MNHVKNMILVPHESVARLNDPTPSTTETQLSALDSEMENMRKKYADDSLKWKLYDEALQRYLHFKGEQTKPVEISISSVNGEENETTSIREQLAEALPKTYKAAALRLYDYLSRADSKVTWDSSGVVSLNNQHVPHSNIIDLILTRSRKDFEPIGKENFVKALSLTNIPLELMPNEKRRNAIILARNQGGGGAVLPITKRRVSKTPKRLTTRVTKKHAWKS
ncbi:Programmed cell death 6-interacting protein [Frankliniella fusca]|uniref:Programmed cell death 6-interacting protein n=1 Tax=Frankliniella fusca TaxID=407009 RepID=A0AAE1HA78_9NEOP|nr:Programmed cell death 6-interacting protein [Frankliniella fusca]